MNNELAWDDLDTRFHEVAAAASRTKMSIKKRVTIFTIAALYWNADRKLKAFAEQAFALDYRSMPGIVLQRIEKNLTELLRALDEVIEISKKNGLHNRTLVSGALYSVASQREKLHDLWVSINASTDDDLAQSVHSARGEESVDWNSLWQ